MNEIPMREYAQVPTVRSLFVPHRYESETGVVYLASTMLIHPDEPSEFVVKTIKPFSDPRFDYETLSARQKAIEEMYTSWKERSETEVYGIANVLEEEKEGKMVISKWYTVDDFRNLDVSKEFCLVVELLPPERRMDVLMQRADFALQMRYATSLATFIAHDHQKRVSLDTNMAEHLTGTP